MSRHIHHLRGCAPAPLAHYLKALGILRLVAEQADPEARLWWQDEHACLATSLDDRGLTAFFTDLYHPTPMVAPWNGGSGFYPRDNHVGLVAIAAGSHPRFAAFREAIASGRQLAAGCADSPKDGAKIRLIAACRASWRGGLGRWLAAAVVIDQDLAPRYPALLGTGGNDGRLDFSNNFMQRLVELFPDGDATPLARPLLETALSGTPTPGLVAGKAIGQFLPGATGGANASNGFDAGSLMNPWDFVLMLEGAVLWTAAASRRLGTTSTSLVSAPFALRGLGAGHGTATTSEETPRGEQWMPLWSQAAGLEELAALLAEGRLCAAQRNASRPIDAARALARLGTTRGISAFQRFGYLERNGMANLAIPLGRWTVRARPDMELIDHAAPWIERLGHAGRADGAPVSWGRSARQGEEALLACCRSAEPRHRQDLLLALGAAEAALARTQAQARDALLQPLQRLPAGWLRALPDSGELRLAVAIAAQQGQGIPLRRHWQTPDGSAFARAGDAEVVATHRSFIPDAVAILRRRCRLAGAFSLSPGHGHAADPADLADLLRGALDEHLLWSLVRPLAALDWTDSSPLPRAGVQPDDHGLAALAGLLRLAHAPPSRLDVTAVPMVDPAILARLLAGDVPGALRIAIHRLAVVGLRCHLTTGVVGPADARRLAACLLIPFHPADIAILARLPARPRCHLLAAS